MEITQAMKRTARLAEFDHYQRTRLPYERFRPLPDALIRAMSDAAITEIGVGDEPEPAPPLPEPEPEEEPAAPRPAPVARIVTARKPKPRQTAGFSRR